MNLALVIIISLIFAALLGGVVLLFTRGIRSGKIGPGVARLLAFFAVLLVMVLFVLLMGLLKNIQG